MTNLSNEPKAAVAPVALPAELSEETLERLASAMDAQARVNVVPSLRSSYPN